jgi:restriction system protein
MSKVWLTRGGRQGQYESFAFDSGTTGGGWDRLGDLSQATNYDEIKDVARGIFVGKSEQAIGTWTGQLWALRIAMEIGDYVLMPRKGQTIVAIGVIASDYIYDAKRIEGERQYRKVDWKNVDVPKTSFGADIQRSLGAQMTICQIKREDITNRVASVLASGVDPFLDSVPDEVSSKSPNEDDVAPNVVNDAQISIQELIRINFPGHELAGLVESVLQATGFKTRLAPPGPDGGVDIVAGKGDLGFEGPRIAVQVKNTQGAMGIAQMNELVGAKTAFGADQALYVSWGGFSPDARRLARNEWFQLRLWDADDLVREVTNVYKQLDASIQNKLPLRQIWVSVNDTETEAG